MYYLSVVLLLLVLPAASVVVEVLNSASADVLWLVGKWFVFWACGVRLLVAGFVQTLNPEFTAKTIFEIEDPSAHAIVREIGFGNLAIGVLGIASVFEPSWTVPAAIVGGLYYGLAGFGHLLRQGNMKERFALWSDLAIFALLAVFVVSRLA